jgi:hypothetical protein
MQWWALHATAEVQAKHKELDQQLRDGLDVGKQELWKAHQLVVQQDQQSNNTEEQQENSDPQAATSSDKTDSKPSSAKDNAATASSSAAQQQQGTLHIEITSGEYAGTAVHLEPKNRKPCWVGRSTGSKFKDRGVSLSRDLEVSTTHGKFELSKGQICYQDTGSTNGSWINDQKIEQGVSYPLESGMEITVGQSVLRVTLL